VCGLDGLEVLHCAGWPMGLDGTGGGRTFVPCRDMEVGKPPAAALLNRFSIMRLSKAAAMDGP